MGHVLPVSRLGEFVGETVTTCGLVVEQRTHHQVTGEPMKFLARGLDRHRRDRTVRANLQKLRVGDSSLSCA